MISILASATTAAATSAPTSAHGVAENMMTPAGWAFMIISWAAILMVFVFCLKRVLKNKEQ